MAKSQNHSKTNVGNPITGPIALALAIALMAAILPLCVAFTQAAFADEAASLQAGEVAATDIEAPAQAKVKNSARAYSITPKVNKAALSYMTEMYIKKYPAMGKEIMYGSAKDKKVLKKYAKMIVKGKKGGAAKCTAIARWVTSNIEYEAGTYWTLPSDVLAFREANCYGFAYTMQALMRANGIPAVVCSGYQGNMKSKITIGNIRNFEVNGHAWVMAYYGKKWHLVDPLFNRVGSTSKSLLDKNYFIEDIEGVSPYYKGMDLTIMLGGSGIFQINGRMVSYTEGKPSEGQCAQRSINFSTFARGVLRDEAESLNGTSVAGQAADMLPNELYTNGWVRLGGDMPGLRYVRPNGVAVTSTFKKYQGKTYYMNREGVPLTCSKSSASVYLTDGAIELKAGQSVTLWPAFVDQDGRFWESELGDEGYKNLVSINGSGKITAKKVKESKTVSPLCVERSEEDRAIPASERTGGYRSVWLDVFVASKAKSFSYKSANPMSVFDVEMFAICGGAMAGKSETVDFIDVDNAKGKVSYKKVSGSKRLTVNKKTGKVTIKKNTKAGSYEAKVKITAKGNSKYLPVTKTITIIVNVD